jgi:hypothetical protein
MEVELGIKVKDKITGFRGVAVARCVYLNGCVQFEIEPLQLKDGVPQKSFWLDEPRVIAIGEKEPKEQVTKKEMLDHVGRFGPQNHPAKKSPPSLAGYED